MELAAGRAEFHLGCIAVGFGGNIGIAVPAGELLRAPVVVGVPEYGPWDVTPVTWLLTIGGTALVAPGISDAGIPAYEATEDTAALLTEGSCGYEYVPNGEAVEGFAVVADPAGPCGSAEAAAMKPAVSPALKNIMKSV